MLHVSAAREILDPYEWLPGYGESSVSFRLDGADAVVEVAYELVSSGACLVKRELRFVRAIAFYWSAFPGAAGLLNVSYDTKWQVGSLIEFEKSDVADAWQRHVNSAFRPRHFLIQFTSENRQIHAIAMDYSLSEELVG